MKIKKSIHDTTYKSSVYKTALQNIFATTCIVETGYEEIYLGVQL